MTVAPQLAVGTTEDVTDDTSYSVFQNLNTPNATQLVFGNIFLGLQGYIAVRVDIGRTKGLDRGATIENGLINAALTFRRAAAFSAGGSADIKVMIDDVQDRGELADTRLAMKYEDGMTNVWRRDFWGQFDINVRRPDSSSIVDLGTGTLNVPLRTAVNVRNRIGQIFTPAGNDTMRDIVCRLQRTGNPSGSVELALYTSENDGWGTIRPDEDNLVAVSAAVLNSSIGTTPNDVVFTFAPDVALTGSTNYWAVLRPSGTPWTEDPANTIGFVQRRGFFLTGGGIHTSGDRFGTEMYRGHVDVGQDINARASADVPWSVPSGASGTTVATPDLTSIVQEAILAAGHETVDALIFAITTSGETRQYRVAAQGHPTLDPPGFACQFTRRNIRGGQG